MHRLYREFAHRYDLHTPPGHYQHDYAFVLRQATRLSESCRLLDVGCGTGVFLENAIAAGHDGYGIDSSTEMVEVARRRLGNQRVRVQRMQDLAEEDVYHLVCSISWPIHYCATEQELLDVLRRFRRSLRSGGIVLLQVANDEQMDGAVRVDREPGPRGEPDDTLFIHRVTPTRDRQHRFTVEYVYASQHHEELLYETHELRFASPSLIVEALQAADFNDVEVVDPGSIAPFIIGKTG